MFCTYITKHPSGKFYLGKSKTSKIREGHYFGSGKRLKDAFKKYPRCEWSVTVIAEFETEQEAYLHEEAIITAETLGDINCLNLKLGGLGQTNNFRHTDEAKARISKSLKLNYETDQVASEKRKQAIVNAWANNSLRDKQSVITVKIGQRAEVKAKRSVNAKKLISRPEHLAAVKKAFIDNEDKRRAGIKSSNAQRRIERFPPKIVTGIYNSLSSVADLMIQYNCSKTVISEIRKKDKKYEYAWT